MAFTTFDTRHAAPTFAQRFATLRQSVAERLAQARAYRATVAELSRLNDRDLEDIGISRLEIASVARQHAKA